VAGSLAAFLAGAAVNSEKACWFVSERCRLHKKIKNVSPRNKVTHNLHSAAAVFYKC
jgi:hypothetical protein